MKAMRCPPESLPAADKTRWLGIGTSVWGQPEDGAAALMERGCRGEDDWECRAAGMSCQRPATKPNSSGDGFSLWPNERVRTTGSPSNQLPFQVGRCRYIVARPWPRWRVMSVRRLTGAAAARLAGASWPAPASQCRTGRGCSSGRRRSILRPHPRPECASWRR